MQHTPSPNAASTSTASSAPPAPLATSPRVVIVGGGLMGLFSAYHIRQRFPRAHITVLERYTPREQLTRTPSALNAHQICPSKAHSIASRGELRRMLWSFAPAVVRRAAAAPRGGGGDAAPQQPFYRVSSSLKLWTDVSFLRFGVHFILRSLHTDEKKLQQNDAKMIAMSKKSQQLLHELIASHPHYFSDIKFKPGLLSIYRSKHEIGANEMLIAGADARQRFLPLNAKKPLLYDAHDPTRPHLFAYDAHDESLCARSFLGRFIPLLREQCGVDVHHGQRVCRLEPIAPPPRGSARGAKSAACPYIVHCDSNESFVADILVLCGGASTAKLCARLRLPAAVPVYPLRGWSLDLHNKENEEDPMRCAVVYEHLYASTYDDGKSLRVGGFGEFVPFFSREPMPNTDRKAELLRYVSRLYLSKTFTRADAATMRLRPCFRPQSADGMPIVGLLHGTNVYVNTGASTLGWTLAAANGAYLAAVMASNEHSEHANAYNYGEVMFSLGHNGDVAITRGTFGLDRFYLLW